MATDDIRSSQSAAQALVAGSNIRSSQSLVQVLVAGSDLRSSQTLVQVLTGELPPADATLKFRVNDGWAYPLVAVLSPDGTEWVLTVDDTGTVGAVKLADL